MIFGTVARSIRWVRYVPECKRRLDICFRLEWEPAPDPLEDEVVKKLASKHRKTSAQIMLRYLVQRNISPIPKSVNENRIKENFNVSLQEAFWIVQREFAF